jgi:uncharacterized membrane protein YdbT with pleckstrin-like domain
MALINCPECGKQVSTEATACPGCGFPVSLQPTFDNLATAPPAQPVNSQVAIREIRPSWWNYGWHLLFCWLIIPLLVALYRRHSYLMRIYSDRVSVKEGFFAKETSEFFIKDIRAIDVRQGIWGRMVGIGDVTISTAATVDAAETAEGVPQPNEIKDMLISQRQQSIT